MEHVTTCRRHTFRMAEELSSKLDPAACGRGVIVGRDGCSALCEHNVDDMRSCVALACFSGQKRVRGRVRIEFTLATNFYTVDRWLVKGGLRLCNDPVAPVTYFTVRSGETNTLLFDMTTGTMRTENFCDMAPKYDLCGKAITPVFCLGRLFVLRIKRVVAEVGEPAHVAQAHQYSLVCSSTHRAGGHFVEGAGAQSARLRTRPAADEWSAVF